MAVLHLFIQISKCWLTNKNLSTTPFTDTGSSLGDLPEAMENRDKWQESAQLNLC